MNNLYRLTERVLSIVKFLKHEGTKEGKTVRFFCHPSIPAEMICPHCMNRMGVHGWLDFPPNGQVVCPGDYVITFPDSTVAAIKPNVLQSFHVEELKGI